MDEWRGQESDGWGEGFEQRPIEIDVDELYVSFWNSSDHFFITTEEQLKSGLFMRLFAYDFNCSASPK